MCVLFVCLFFSSNNNSFRMLGLFRKGTLGSISKKKNDNIEVLFNYFYRADQPTNEETHAQGISIIID